MITAMSHQPQCAMLQAAFFDRDACTVARQLLGKVIRRRYQGRWLAARIIETEAYYKREKASHASLGYTHKRRALFMPAGTIYMYYARGQDSLNVSTRGAGNAVLIKSALPFVDAGCDPDALAIMQSLNPDRQGRPRPPERLCRGQSLLCKALSIRVADWDAQAFDAEALYIEDAGIEVKRLVQTTRLGIPTGRDEHLPYRFIDLAEVRRCCKNPLTRRGAREGRDYWLRKA